MKSKTTFGGERLWLSSEGLVVCETVLCAGVVALEAIRATRTAQNAVTGEGGVKFHVLNEADIVEMGELMARSGEEFRCNCGRARYNPPAKSVQITERPSLYR